MTLRKFLRFFKHFPRYMKKDFMWLMNKLRGKKLEKGQKQENKNLAKFAKKLSQIVKESECTYVIKYGNFYYACFKKSPQKFYKIWKNVDTLYVEFNNKTWEFKVGDSRTLSDIFAENGMAVEYGGTSDENFMILLKGKSNLTAVKENDTYKVYQNFGKQKPRLLYKITWEYLDECYSVTMVETGKKTPFLLNYNPAEILDTILIKSNLT